MRNEFDIPGGISPRAFEAALTAEIILATMETRQPLACRMELMGEDGKELMYPPVPHPILGEENKGMAFSKLREFVRALLNGEKVPLDRTPIARISTDTGDAIDLSLESFAKSALGDDGTMILSAGWSGARPGSQESLALNRQARVVLFSPDGNRMRREKAKAPLYAMINERLGNAEKAGKIPNMTDSDLAALRRAELETAQKLSLKKPAETPAEAIKQNYKQVADADESLDDLEDMLGISSGDDGDDDFGSSLSGNDSRQTDEPAEEEEEAEVQQQRSSQDDLDDIAEMLAMGSDEEEQENSGSPNAEDSDEEEDSENDSLIADSLDFAEDDFSDMEHDDNDASSSAPKASGEEEDDNFDDDQALDDLLGAFDGSAPASAPEPRDSSETDDEGLDELDRILSEARAKEDAKGGMDEDEEDEGSGSSDSGDADFEFGSDLPSDDEYLTDEEKEEQERLTRLAREEAELLDSLIESNRSDRDNEPSEANDPELEALMEEFDASHAVSAAPPDTDEGAEIGSDFDEDESGEDDDAADNDASSSDSVSDENRTSTDEADEIGDFLDSIGESEEIPEHQSNADEAADPDAAPDAAAETESISDTVACGEDENESAEEIRDGLEGADIFDGGAESDNGNGEDEAEEEVEDNEALASVSDVEDHEALQGNEGAAEDQPYAPSDSGAAAPETEASSEAIDAGESQTAPNEASEDRRKHYSSTKASKSDLWERALTVARESGKLGGEPDGFDMVELIGASGMGEERPAIQCPPAPAAPIFVPQQPSATQASASEPKPNSATQPKKTDNAMNWSVIAIIEENRLDELLERFADLGAEFELEPCDDARFKVEARCPDSKTAATLSAAAAKCRAKVQTKKL